MPGKNKPVPKDPLLDKTSCTEIDSMPRYGKIYGAKRTGTNYLRKVLYDNFLSLEIFMNVGGWKHGNIIEYPGKDDLLNMVDVSTRKETAVRKTIDLFRTNRVLFIVCVKNPYMWLNSVIEHTLSIQRRRYRLQCRHRRSTCRPPLSPIQQGIDKEFIIKEVENWNMLYRNYRTYIESGKAELIRYEDLLENPKAVLVNISIKRKWKIIDEDSLKLTSKYMSANTDSVVGGHRGVSFDKEKYLKPNIGKVLSKNAIKIVNDNIDLSLLEFYDYKLVNQ